MKKTIEFILPHIKDNHANLAAVKEKGADQWLSEQEKKWKCPECNTPFAWYSKKCLNCGKDLKKYTFRFSFFKAKLLKFGLKLNARKQDKRLK
jgi:rubrerythrin